MPPFFVNKIRPIFIKKFLYYKKNNKHLMEFLTNGIFIVSVQTSLTQHARKF